MSEPTPEQLKVRGLVEDVNRAIRAGKIIFNSEIDRKIKRELLIEDWLKSSWKGSAQKQQEMDR